MRVASSRSECATSARWSSVFTKPLWSSFYTLSVRFFLYHPESTQPNCHVPGFRLPGATFVNDVGYLSGGAPLNRVGNVINHPENIQPDMHTPGSHVSCLEIFLFAKM